MASSQKYLCIFLILLQFTNKVELTGQGDTIESWAYKLGTELFELGRAVTKSHDIRGNYSLLNARVEEHDPYKLLNDIVDNIISMMNRKIKAVTKIMETAEEIVKTFEYTANDTGYEYYNSKFSPVDNIEIELPEPYQDHEDVYRPMFLNNDTHFYNIPVNTSFSSVHLPVNIYDRHRDAKFAIQWSEALDDVFVENYNLDPALSWQYFGSSSGIMRHYPAMHWKDSDIDTYDCRIRTWYIEAATCTKDVLILIDSSGSMQGMRKHIASLTLNSILDTFSNNDYLNVMNYSTKADFLVPCFKDILVQATKENIQTFKNAVAAIDPDKKSNASFALGKAFELLEEYREKKCSNDSGNCNQVIMLITDGISGNLSSVFEKYNRLENGSTIPVRVFTYLVGAEVTRVNEIMWAACTNRGYYVHIQSLEQVSGSVFKYIPVIARPLVLTGDHTASWTHAYADITHNNAADNILKEQYRLLTSVAVPAFDKNSNETAQLLGVAATDVPIDDIVKLTTPYKLGVMAYAFIVSNNGYVLMHPSFRPVFNKTVLKENYNSVDFAEVEQHYSENDNLKAREINQDVLDLRNDLVFHLDGSKHNAKLKYHYDNMRRISPQTYDYYYTGLNGTPFSFGFALPDIHGKYSIQVIDEIINNIYQNINLTSFFAGNNWKIHPKWVYCKYHYLEGHEFHTPESELLHFLIMMNDNYANFKWESQFEKNAKIENDDYYCDKELLQKLIFDAKLTKIYDGPYKFRNVKESELIHRYNVTIRFVATMSGLTRWQYINAKEEHLHQMEFGDFHARAIDETWYKSAILQHQHDSESFVFSVPFDAGERDDEDILVTASYAIFLKDGGHEAPGSVVGFQFAHDNLRERFLNITSEAKHNALPCGEVLDCYVIDNSGYVIISNNSDHTGQFFGEIEGAIMETMLKEKIFEKIVIYDFQGLCINDTDDLSSDGGILRTPLDVAKTLVNYVIGNIFWFFLKTNLYQLWNPNWVLAEDISTTTPFPTLIPEQGEEEEDNKDGVVIETDESEKKKKEKVYQYFPCDLQRDLFVLNQTKITKEHTGRGIIPETSCSRSFYLKQIPHSNLIFIAVNSTLTNCDIMYTTAPTDVDYDPGIVHPCQKINLITLPRSPLSGCYNTHEDESKINLCGRSSRNIIHSGTFIATILLLLILS